VREPIYISRAKHEAAAELKRVLPQFMLMLSAGSRPFPCCCVILAKEMQKVCRLQFHGPVGPARFVDQKREGKARFLPKHSRVIAVAQSNRGQGSSFISERLLVLAQLRDVLAAKDSTVVPEEYQDSWLLGPQRPKQHLPPIGIGKRDLCEPKA
jgi:hypothetical protein